MIPHLNQDQRQRGKVQIQIQTGELAFAKLYSPLFLERQHDSSAHLTVTLPPMQADTPCWTSFKGKPRNSDVGVIKKRHLRWMWRRGSIYKWIALRWDGWYPVG